MPEYTRANLADLDSDVAGEATLFLDEKNTARFEFFSTIKRQGAVSPLTRQRTTRQQELTHFITCLKDWDEISDLVEGEVETFKFMCLDTESFLPNHRKLAKTPAHKQNRHEQERLLYVLVGTLRGRGIIFDIEAMYGGTYSRNVDPTIVLPDIIKRWISQDDIIVAGSDIMDDIKTLNLPARKLAELSIVFSKAMTPVGDLEALVDIGQTRACGLGVQSYYARGEDYKPMTATKYIKRYGNHGYKHLAKNWPDSREPTKLYKWAKDLCGQVTETQKLYLYLDATAGAALVAALIIERYIKGSFQAEPSDSIARLVELQLGPEFKSAVAELNGPEDQGEVRPQTTPHKRPAADSPEAGPSRKVARSGQDKPSQTDDDIEVLAYIGMDLKRCLPGTSFPYFDAEMREMNPYVANPVLPRVCLYCGSANHSKLNKDKQPLCPRMDEELENRVRCRYVGCNDRTTHHTIACKTLHRRCMRWHHRGHGDEDGCETWDERDWEQAKERFERAAGDGLWTRNRKWERRYGFYCHVMGTAYPFKKTYGEVRDMGVWAADRLLGIRDSDNRIMYGRTADRTRPTSNRHGGRSQGQRRSYWR